MSQQKKLKIPCEIRDLQVVPGSDKKKGDLVISEPTKLFDSFDFSINRYYYINNYTGKESVRGGHYHDDEKVELMTCIQGVLKINLISRCRDGHLIADTIVLDGRSPKVLLIPPYIWHEVILGDNSILLVASNCTYEPGESITSLPPYK